MALTEKERQRIIDEETLRYETRRQLCKQGGHGRRWWWWVLAAFLFVFFWRHAGYRGYCPPHACAHGAWSHGGGHGCQHGKGWERGDDGEDEDEDEVKKPEASKPAAPKK